MMSAVTLWMVRAGWHGEAEYDALNGHVVGIGWPELGDLTRVGSAGNLRLALDAAYPGAKPSALADWGDQVEAFRFRMRAGDLVALPLRSAPAVAFGRLTGDYRYAPGAVAALRHQRPVEWLAEDVPRDWIDQDLLHALGAGRCVGPIGGNDADYRIEALLAATPPLAPAGADLDLSQEGRDQIRRRVARQFKDHELARLVGALLKAEGFICDVCPPGPDGGVDILAGPGAVNLAGGALAVRVKPGATAVDAAALHELKGAMSNVGAQRGLLVGWGGFTKEARQEARGLFFEIRLWDSDAVIGKLQEVYDRLPASIRAEIPLQRVWAPLPEDV
jgi:restriction system protein